jgi:nitrogen PTS system EIIA component
MDLEQLARLLGRDSRELGKLANRGQLPGRKVGGAWRFAAAEIHHWVEREMPAWSEKEHDGFDPVGPVAGFMPLVATLLHGEGIDLNFQARTRNSAMRELVKLAARTGAIADAEAIRQAIAAREARASTAWRHGFATPHPHRRLPNALNDSVIAMARAPGGIPFGAERGGLTDLFFLVCCTDDRQHLRVLSRLSRILRKPGFADELRDVQAPQDVQHLIKSAEIDLCD